jgi:hypothetical protein
MNTFPRIIVAFFATAILSTAGCGGGGGGDTPLLRLPRRHLRPRVELRELALR